MRHRIRAHLSYANVVATLSLFLVIGGGTALASYVVSSNSEVGPGTISGHNPPTGDHANIIGGSINASDLANSAVPVSKLAANSVATGKVIDNSLTGADVADGSLLLQDLKPGTLGAEAPHVVGAAGEPAFHLCQTSQVWYWEGFVSAPAFYRDSAGVVHLQGDVECAHQTPDSPTIFTLPLGYRPAAFQNHLVIEGNANETNVVTVSDSSGDVALADLAGNPVPGATFIGLDGITFRCGPSGQNGCP
jgi:hypothetical protein